MTADFWNEERVDELRALIKEGLSYSKIGARWGVSRNVPLSKANRIGIGIDHPNSPGPIGDPRRYRTQPMTTLDRLDALNRFPSLGDCVFPVGHPGGEHFHFCGSPTAITAAPYCHAHLRVAHEARQRLAARKAGVAGPGL